MTYQISQLGIIHLDDCFNLDQKALKGLWTKSQWKKELSDPKRICLGALEYESKKLLSFCSAWIVLDELQITSIAVHPLHLRKGIGKNMLADLIKKSKFLRVNKIHLEVKDSNEPAKALYESMGFKLNGKRSNFYEDGSNALNFIKVLSNNL